MNLNILKTGDLIVRQKGPASTHFIVYIGKINGVETVAENQSGIGVRYTTLTEALNNNKIKRFEPFGGSESQRQLVISKINGLLGKPYDLIIFNCEHFARWISTGKMESKQVKLASNLAMASGVAMLKSKNKTVQLLGLFSLAVGLIGRISQ